MPRLSRWFVRASLFYLLLGFSAGRLLLAHKGVMLHPALWLLLPAHIEFLLLGWIVQLAMGVAYWILPRRGQETARSAARSGWLAFGLLNLGLWLVALGPFSGAPGVLPLAGRLCEAGAALAFARHAWPRVRAAGA